MSLKTDERARETWEGEGGRTPSQAEIRDRGIAPPDYYTERRFQIPDLKGISRKNIEEHLKLYAGHVKFSNFIVNRIRELLKDDDPPSERPLLQRQLAYEHNGMRNHEAFFEQFEGGASGSAENGAFGKQVSKDFGSRDGLVSRLKGIAMTRGVGWTMLYHCHKSGHLIPHWVEEHHIGILSGPSLILALDLWEHAFVYDYPTSEKKKYVDALFENLNWRKVEARFAE